MEESSSSPSSAAAAAEYEPLLLRLDSHSQIPRLSSESIQHLMERRSAVERRWWPRLIASESRVLWKLCGSSIAVSILNYMLTFFTLMLAGHLGILPFAAASIAAVGFQALAYAIMFGMAGAVQTVCGQAYGAKRYSGMGIICQRAIILLLGAALLLTFLFWYSGTVLKAIGLSESIAEEGQVFARGIILQLYAFALNFPMQRFLQAQNIVNPLAFMSLGVFLLHVLISWLVVNVLNFGLLGAALSLSFSWWVLAIVNGLYIILSPRCKNTWTGFSLKAFSRIWPYFKITLASAVMSCLDMWYLIVLVLISGLLSNPTVSLDSISICVNYLVWDLQFMSGLSAAASIRVGNELGAGHPRVAEFSVFVVNGTSIVISIILCAIVLIFRVGLSKLFTSNTQVIEAVSDLCPLLAFSIFLNGIQPILSGVAIGCGWQGVVAYINLASYYVIGLTIGYVLGFKTSLGVVGIWWGMIIGVSVQTFTLIILTSKTNWDYEVEKAVARVKRSEEDETLDRLVGNVQ